MRRNSKHILASAALGVALSLSVFNAPAFAAASEKVDASAPIGRITAAFGIAKIQDANGAHGGDLHALINNDDRIVTDGGGVSVLLASRVVVKVDAASAISIREGQGETNIVLEYGTVHVFVGQRPADYGPITLLDPQSRLESANGVFLASYDPQTKKGYYACEHAKLTVIAREATEPCIISANEQAEVESGRLLKCGDTDRLAFMDHTRSSEQLGQSIMEQGGNTLRLRSRTFDTEVALQQLAAAGWINRELLTKDPGGSNAILSAKKKKTTKDDDKNTPTDDQNSNTSTSTTLVQTPRHDKNNANSGATNSQDTNSEATNSPETPVATSGDTVTVTTREPGNSGAAVATSTPERPAAPASPAASPTLIPITIDRLAPDATVTQAQSQNQPSNLVIDTSSTTTLVPTAAEVLPSVAADNSGPGNGRGNNGRGNHGRGNNGGDNGRQTPGSSDVVATQSNSAASAAANVPVAPPAPTIDLGIGDINVADTSLVTPTVGAPSAAVHAPITNSISVPRPNDLPVLNTPTAVAPPHADLGLGSPSNSGPGSSSSGPGNASAGTAIAPPTNIPNIPVPNALPTVSTTAPPPRIDLGMPSTPTASAGGAQPSLPSVDASSITQPITNSIGTAPAPTAGIPAPNVTVTGSVLASVGLDITPTAGSGATPAAPGGATPPVTPGATPGVTPGAAPGATPGAAPTAGAPVPAVDLPQAPGAGNLVPTPTEVGITPTTPGTTGTPTPDVPKVDPKKVVKDHSGTAGRGGKGKGKD